MESSSPLFRLNWVDIFKGLRGSLVVFAAAFTVGGLQEILAQLEAGAIDLGQVNFARDIAIAGASFLLEEARRYFKNYSK